MDKAAIAWSIAIVAAGVAIAFVGQSGQNLGVEIQSPQAVVKTGTIESPGYEKTSPQTDPFASIAEKVKQNPSSTETVGQEISQETKTMETMKNQTKTFEEGLAKSSEKDVIAEQEKRIYLKKQKN